ncbi:MAG: hypothetical protein HZB38_14880 [Planctomycetes bacterium]|nr:hypothetical protein [Planctomycetota bacterium]
MPAAPAAPAGPTTVIARLNDTLCGIAVENGFADCTPLRGVAANAPLLNRALQPGDVVTLPAKTEGLEAGQTEATHTFQRPNDPIAAIRFVHGTPNQPYEKDPTLIELNVSNYQTDLAGANRKKAFVNVNHRKFDADAHADVDTFKVEVRDQRTQKTDLDVRIEARRPTYDANEVFTGVMQDFPGDINDANSERGKRSLKTQVSKQAKSKNCFRSGYLRLVVDKVDKAARPDQTILTTDMVEGGDELVEILDQTIRAEYELDTCPAPAGQSKCRVATEIQLCDLGKQRKAKLTVHILRSARGGAGVVTIDQARKGLRRFLRGVYAQAHMSLKFIDPKLRLVEPVANLIAIADANGRRSQGNQQIAVQVTIDGAVFNASINTQANVLPITTANDLAAALRAVLPAGTRVVASENKPLIGQAIGSADVVVGDPLTQDVQATITTSNDARHPATVGRVAAQLTTEFGGNDSHVGTIHERAVFKNYDTGADRIDLYVIDLFPAGSNTLGEAFIPNQNSAASRRPAALAANTCFVLDHTLLSDQAEYTVTPHELGHILLDANHSSASNDLMFATVGAPIPMTGTKRITDTGGAGTGISFDNGVFGNPVRMLRSRNAGCVDGW